MQEEVENRTVNLAISTTKLTGRTLVSAFNAWKRHRAVAKTAKEKAAEAKEAEAAKPPRGKQTIKELIGQNQGVSSIPIENTDIRDFERIANKYGVDYAITRDTSEVPPRYNVFFKARDNDALTAAFKEYSASVLTRKTQSKSLLKELQKYKALCCLLYYHP